MVQETFRCQTQRLLQPELWRVRGSGPEVGSVDWSQTQVGASALLRIGRVTG